MQFNRQARKLIRLKGERNAALYPYAIQFYKEPPTDVITLEEFEQLAIERLQVLRIVEHAGAKHNRNSQDYRETIINELRNKNLSSYYKISGGKMEEQVFDERKRDHISHFILRLAYCKNDTLRRWFINQEVDLFRMRFMSEKTAERKGFMEYNELSCEPVSEDEKKGLLSKLAASNIFSSSAKAANQSYYKVPFTEVLDLVSSRKVYLRRGIAYIGESDFVSIVVSAFRAHLSHALAVAARTLPQLEEDGRLMSILGTLNQRYVGTDYAKAKSQFTGDVGPEMLDELSKISYPLCMRTLHEKLRANHHLKYFGRLQYGLYLKGIGLSLEDALKFWRQEFSKVMDIDKFDKAYAYSVRFNYGKEGKRTNYTPYSCMKIITSSTPGPGEFHGCPFKHWDAAHLQQKLSELKLGNKAVSEIVDLTKKNHYQLACTRYFEATHNEASVEQAIQHPNQFFIESEKVRKGDRKEIKGSSQIQTSRAVMYESSQPSCSSTPQNDNIDDDFEMTEDIEDLLKGI